MSIDSELRSSIRRHYFVNHFKINAICEKLNVHHDTVKAAINYHSFVTPKGRPSKSYWFDYEEFIHEMLKSHPKITSPRLYEMLMEKGARGHKVGSLRRFVRRIRPQYKEAFIKRNPLAAEEGQVDWGHFGSLKVGGIERKLYCFVMTLSWSRYTFAKFTLDLKTETFLNCHVEAFKYFKGVPKVLLYDNLKSIVIERQGAAVRFNTTALDFSSHYLFELRACNVYRGNEKGRVERTIRFIRNSFFEARDLTNINNLNEEMLIWLNKTANQRPWPDNKDALIIDKYNEEQPKLIGLPPYHPMLESSKIVKAGKYAHITFDLNTYSIPRTFVSRALLVRSSQDKVKIYADAELIAEHSRSWDKGQEIYIKKHRDDLIATKKKGNISARRGYLMEETPEMKVLFESLADRGEPLRSAVNRLTELKETYGPALFCEAVRQALAQNSPTPESIAFILMNLEQEKGEKPRFIPHLPAKPEVRDMQITSHDLDSYDDL